MANNTNATLWSQGQSFSKIALSRRERESEYADDIALEKALAWVEGLTSEDLDSLYYHAAKWEFGKMDLAKMLIEDHNFRDELINNDIID